MPTNINPGYLDTPIVAGKQKSFKSAPVNFGADFRLKEQTANEVIITNITSPVDRPETYRFASQEIKDVYKSSGISAGRIGPVRSGRSIVVQHNSILAVEDSSDPTAQDSYHVPVGVHMVIRTANSEYVTTDVVIAHIERLLAALQDTGSDEASRLSGLLRGNLKPKDI